jgi:acyl-CoA thioesterase FadM
VVHAWERRRERDRFTFDLQICDDSGTLVEAWEGLELQAIESLTPSTGWPTALLGPFLERRLDELLPGSGLEIRVGEDLASANLLAGLLGAGRPVLRRADGRPEADQPVSAAHSGRLVLAATAPHPVGCDLEAVEERDLAVWSDLLGERLAALARTLAEEQRSGFDEAATRIWAALEALKKAGASLAQAPLVLEQASKDWAILASGDYRVAAWAGNVGPAPARMAVAVAVARGVLGQREDERPQPAYTYRHVVGFGDTNLVGNVYFAHFLEWQGRCREMFLRDKAPSVARDLAFGLSLVTTHCSCEFLQELQAFDEVRLEMRLKEAHENRLELVFEYWVERDGIDQLVARGKQGIACLWAEKTGKPRTAIPSALVAALRPYAKGSMTGAMVVDDPDTAAEAAYRAIPDAAE